MESNIEEIMKLYPKFEGKQAHNFVDITNQTFGYLTVLYRYYKNSNDRKAQWVCRCKCGNIIIVYGKHLRSGNTHSCGCYKTERIVQTNEDRANIHIDDRFGKLVVLNLDNYKIDSNGETKKISSL